MDAVFSTADWFEGLDSARRPGQPPSWCKNVHIGSSRIAVTVNNDIGISDLSVDVGSDVLVVCCATHSDALVVRNVHVDAGTPAAKWSIKSRTLRVAVTCDLVSPMLLPLQLPMYSHSSNVDVGVPPRMAETVTHREASVANSLQSTFASIAEFNRSADRIDALASAVHSKTMAVIGRRTSASCGKDMSDLQVEDAVDCEPICVEGLALFEDSERMYGPPTVSTGQQWWPAGLAMLRLLREHPEVVPGDRPCKVVEIGSGLGLVGMFVGKHWPNSSVLLTDMERALPALVKGVVANFPEEELERVKVQALPWGPVGKTECEEIGMPDVVLGADVCYRNDLTDLALWTLCRLRAPCTLIAIADREGAVHNFTTACARCGITFGAPWHVPGSEVERAALLFASHDIFIFRLFCPRRVASPSDG